MWWVHPMTCTEGCRTLLWEGTGMPEYDSDGSCSCDCDDDRWSDHNALGHPSCVPVKAHLVFGWIGLVLSVAALFHAVYHLRRQLRFHECHQSASTSAVERCRRELHTAAIAVSTLHICFYGMVLGDRLLHSVAVLSIVQIPISISAAILVTRMWIYTNDPILMRKSPEVLRISRWLETLAGRRMAYGFVSISPVCALVLDMMNYPETAMKVVAAGIILLCGACIPAMFWVCGRSLIRAIDASVLQQRQQQDVSAADVKGHEGQQSKQRNLLRARQKVQTIVMVVFFVCGKSTGLLLFAVCSKYGTAVPLLLYAAPMVYIPPLWNALHIQLHAGRTKLSSDGGGLTSTPFNMFSLSAISIWRSRVVQSGVINRVVPDEVSP